MPSGKPVSQRTKEKIKEARASGKSIYHIAEMFGVSHATVNKIVPGRMKDILSRSPPVVPAPRPELSKADLGEAARQVICAKLMFSGVSVFRPLTEDTPVDLLVLKADGSTAKCQCKYM